MIHSVIGFQLSERATKTGAIASLSGSSGQSAFDSAKSGVRTLAQATAKEYADEGGRPHCRMTGYPGSASGRDKD